MDQMDYGAVLPPSLMVFFIYDFIKADKEEQDDLYNVRVLI